MNLMIDLLLGAIVAVALGVGFLLTASMLASRLAGSSCALTRAMTTFGVLAWLAAALFHGLASVGKFSRTFALVSVAGLVAATWSAGGGWSGLSDRLRRDRRFIERLIVRHRRSRYRGTVVAFVVCALPPLVRMLILPPLGWDSLTYHSTKAAMWVQSGTVSGMDGPGPWAYYRNMLGGGEVWFAWAMLPTHTDALMPIVELSQWLALGLGLILLARRLGVREPFASTAAAFTLALPTLRLTLGSGYVELGLLSTLIAGFALGLSADRRRPGLVVVAAGLLGVAAATKAPMVPISAVALVILIARIVRQPIAHPHAWALAAVIAYAAALAPWLVMAATRTGAPLSPIPVHMGSLVLGEAPPELAWYSWRIVPAEFHRAIEAKVLAAVFALPGSGTDALGIFALAPLLVAVFGIPRLVGRAPYGGLLIATAVFGCVAGYYAPGFGVVRHYWSVSSSRFLLPVVALASVVSVAWCRPGGKCARAYRWMLLTFALWNLLEYETAGFSPASVHGSLLALVGLLALGAACVGVSLLPQPMLRVAVALAVAVIAVAGLESLRNRFRNDLFAHDYAIESFGPYQYWAQAVPLVDEPGVRRRIAVTSGPNQNLDNWLTYPFMGRALQNELVYVPLSEDGQIRHFGRGGLNESYVESARFDAWRRRLRKWGVTDVLSFEPPSIELAWMKEHADQFERLSGTDEGWGLFRVLEP